MICYETNVRGLVNLFAATICLLGCCASDSSFLWKLACYDENLSFLKCFCLYLLLWTKNNCFFFVICNRRNGPWFITWKLTLYDTFLEHDKNNPLILTPSTNPNDEICKNLSWKFLLCSYFGYLANQVSFFSFLNVLQCYWHGEELLEVCWRIEISRIWSLKNGVESLNLFWTWMISKLN